jgi:hypothetical protein
LAEHLEKSDIKALPVTAYTELRSKLRTGDLMFASGDYLLSQAIQSVTESPWSHVGVIVRLKEIDRVLLLESVEDSGVRFAPLSKYTNDYADGKPYRGRLAVARVSDIQPPAVAKVTQFGVDELTRPYDKDEVAKILARVALGIGRKERDREYICSELVYECFAHAGREFNFDPKGFISPGMIWRDPKVSFLGRFQ